MQKTDVCIQTCVLRWLHTDLYGFMLFSFMFMHVYEGTNNVFQTDGFMGIIIMDCDNHKLIQGDRSPNNHQPTDRF